MPKYTKLFSDSHSLLWVFFFGGGGYLPLEFIRFQILTDLLKEETLNKALILEAQIQGR